MPPHFIEGLIYLILKSEGPSLDIKKWCPITILNMVYKILVKAISIRLRTKLHIAIQPTQRSCIRERSILDNIYTFWEFSALATKSKQKLAIVMLDLQGLDYVLWQWQVAFKNRWQGLHLSSDTIAGPKWNYAICHKRATPYIPCGILSMSPYLFYVG